MAKQSKHPIKGPGAGYRDRKRGGVHKKGTTTIDLTGGNVSGRGRPLIIEKKTDKLLKPASQIDVF